MRWSNIGVTVSVTSTAAANGSLIIASSIASNYGQLVYRVFNASTAVASFTLNIAASLSNTDAIPISGGQDIVVAASNTELYISASSLAIQVTPGVAPSG